MDLLYFRDVDGREVDFVVTLDKIPLMFVECKWSDTAISPALKYLKERYPKCAAWQISAIGTKDFVDEKGIRICPAGIFLASLI